MPLLQNQVAFITGAASGIGQAAAIRFAQEGARIAFADLPSQQDQAQITIQHIHDAGSKALFIPCDVSQPLQVQNAVQKSLQSFGHLNIVFANAGINGVWAPIDELTPEEWDHTLAVNLRSTFLTVHFTVPHLKSIGGGSILICSSVNGNRTFSSPGASAYSTSKAGQIAFMKMAALELAQFNIRVNAVCPGAIHTNIHENTHKRGTEKIEIKIELPNGQPGIHHGQGQPHHVADSCLFLASPLSKHISGVEIYVDGGASLL